MNDLPITANIELLSNGQYPDQWITLNPGKWKMNPAGELVQESAAGTRRGGSGAITAQKIPVSSAIFGLQLTLRPGSKQESGIVFNLVDEKNFCAFCVDVHSKPNTGYSLLAFSVKAGDYDIISKQNYKGKLPEAITLTLRQAGADLALFFNDTLSYLWADMLMFGKRIGLYSYKNTDAAFISFNVLPFPILSAASEKSQRMAEAPVKDEVPVNNEVIVTQQPQSQPLSSLAPTVNRIPENGITKFLGIRKPASKTEIEFTEVFTVPLDSFYASLYQNSNLGTSDDTETGSVQVETLDLRVKRWYRDLKMIRENIEFKKLDIKLAAGRVSELEQQLSEENENANDKTYGELLNKLPDRRKEYRVAVRELNELRDQEAVLKREIRINGYAVDKTTTKSILDLGYNFEIISQSLGPSLFKPVKFAPGLDLSKDEVWAGAENELYHQLFDSNTITEKGAELYEEERKPLITFEAHKTLAKKRDDLVKEIADCEALIKMLQPAVDKAEKEIADWTADKEELTAQKKLYAEAVKKLDSNWTDVNHFPYYFPTVNWDLSHPVAWAGVGWLTSKEKVPLSSEDLYPLHPEFKKDFALQPGYSNASRYRLKKFIADVFYEGSRYRLFTALSIYCPTGPGTYLSFYHKLDAVYYNKFNYY